MACVFDKKTHISNLNKIRVLLRLWIKLFKFIYTYIASKPKDILNKINFIV